MVQKNFHPSSLIPSNRFLGGMQVCRYAGMHGGGKRLNKHIFHTIFQTRILDTYPSETLHLM